MPHLLFDVGSVNASIAVARKRAKESLMFAMEMDTTFAINRFVLCMVMRRRRRQLR